jgi:putative nucleotidyltransferase with HDIG domain
MANPCAKDIIAEISQIGSLPQTLAAVLKVINNPKSNADEIADVVSRDVALTSRVLRMVNSAHAGRRRKVTKVSEAVIVMGLNSIKVLTLSSSVFALVTDQELLRKCNIKRIWRHLIETATNAKSIAVSVKYREPEEAFVAGIMHDIGIVVMLLYFKEKYLDLYERMKKDRKGIIQAEIDVFGMTHAEVGAEMINFWKIPPAFAYAALNHHALDSQAIIAEDATLNDIVALADRLSMGPFDDYFPDIEENLIFIQNACQRLKLDAAEANRIRKEAILESIKMAEYLELDIGDILEILTEANDRLAELYFSLEKIFMEKQKLQELVNSPGMNTEAKTLSGVA